MVHEDPSFQKWFKKGDRISQWTITYCGLLLSHCLGITSSRTDLIDYMWASHCLEESRVKELPLLVVLWLTLPLWWLHQNGNLLFRFITLPLFLLEQDGLCNSFGTACKWLIDLLSGHCPFQWQKLLIYCYGWLFCFDIRTGSFCVQLNFSVWHDIFVPNTQISGNIGHLKPRIVNNFHW